MSDSGGGGGRVQPPPPPPLSELPAQPVKMNAISASVTRQLAPQMARPLGNSQGDLRVKVTPPDLPLRRGGSVDRVAEAQEVSWNSAASMGRSTSGSTSDSLAGQ